MGYGGMKIQIRNVTKFSSEKHSTEILFCLSYTGNETITFHNKIINMLDEGYLIKALMGVQKVIVEIKKS